MMIKIANPIYDSVFKYLVEDNRIAKTLISALLKKEVLDVEMNRHEYTNGTRDNISMFRIDFAAHVREDDGHVRLILIELQKTWLETETLRFRQYLGAQYANPDNIIREERHGFGVPMVAVYLLGHKVGEIEEPIVYATHKAYDYNGKEVTRGIPDPFVESLVHDSIIVQIPRLHGHVNNRLEKILSVFDQTQKDAFNRQVLNIDEDTYEDDTDMMYILRRLLAAASDSKLRQDMNVEDEFYSAIENRDTAIMNRDKKIVEQDHTITKQRNAISKQRDTITKQWDAITKQRDAITKQRDAITKQQSTISEQNNTINEQNNTISEQNNTISEQNKMLRSAIRGLMDKGMSVEEIAQLTGRSIDEIQELA